jgi:hypothetical protein
LRRAFATLADSANDVMTLLKQEVPAVTGEARAGTCESP